MKILIVTLMFFCSLVAGNNQADLRLPGEMVIITQAHNKKGVWVAWLDKTVIGESSLRLLYFDDPDSARREIVNILIEKRWLQPKSGEIYD